MYFCHCKWHLLPIIFSNRRVLEESHWLLQAIVFCNSLPGWILSAYRFSWVFRLSPAGCASPCVSRILHCLVPPWTLFFAAFFFFARPLLLQVSSTTQSIVSSSESSSPFLKVSASILVVPKFVLSLDSNSECPKTFWIFLGPLKICLSKTELIGYSRIPFYQ